MTISREPTEATLLHASIGTFATLWFLETSKYVPVISTLRKPRQEDDKFQASQSHIIRKYWGCVLAELS